MLNATMCPRPTSCNKFSLGTWQFSKKMAVVELPLRPIFFSSAPAENPGNPRSTIKQENFSPSTLAKTMYTSAKPPLVIHIFCPFKIQERPSGESTARVREFCASEPACGSERQYAASFSPVASNGRYFFFCSGVPKKTIGSVPMPACPPWLTPNEAYADNFSASCTVETLSSPAPPYS